MDRDIKYLISITLLILTAFLFLAISSKNYEFISYWVVLVLLFIFVIKFGEKFKFPKICLVLFAIWSILHMAGGLIKFGSTRLYDLILWDLIGDPFFILRYDQAIHLYCYFVISMLTYFTLKKYISGKGNAIIIFSILSALGIGLLNEVIEFGLVIFAGAAETVGDYYNTALDLVFNLLGALIGPIFARRYLDKNKNENSKRETKK